MCASKSMASICDFDEYVRVRPYLGQWHQYVIIWKTTSGTLALYDICVIIRVSYPILNGSSGIDKL
ncbi:tRNA (guanine-N(7)-)-methyltransferase subunit WDR4 [Gossypium arboreum]|uniref:tRNA (Guanine-N(7)-)-methyltransferase subunit WDR4 n=1 Tax=Gossypium arboreum TaxID=29729 RepID=A0A0B0N9Q4_GOSAR|nr:tRNA (guanine-N(7)-)-methyltransferase subunit WDR4 [Gossypium arboreum]